MCLQDASQLKGFLAAAQADLEAQQKLNASLFGALKGES